MRGNVNKMDSSKFPTVLDNERKGHFRNLTTKLVHARKHN